MSKTQKRVYLFARVSLPERAYQKLEGQLAALKEHCKQKQYRIVGMSSVTGMDEDGEADLEAILARIEEKKDVDILLLTNICRLTKDSRKMIVYLKRFEELNVQVETMDDGFVKSREYRLLETPTTAERDAAEMFQPMGANCKYCHGNMRHVDGCIRVPIKHNAEEYEPIKVGDPEDSLWNAEPNERCPDCNALYGHYHHPNCDLERCPVCGGQLIGCGCMDEEYDETDDEY